MEIEKAPIPLYYKIIKYFHEQIQNGKLKAGDRLPTESELIKMFGVSRITVRLAMERLKFSGFVVRQRAKGTFVSDHVKPTRTILLSGHIKSIVEEAKKYDIKILDKTTIPAPEKAVQYFKISAKDSVCRIRRIRIKDEIPFSYVVNYLPVEIGNKITIKELEKLPLLEILRDKFGIVGLSGEETIEAKNAFEISEFLKIDPIDPVLFMEIVYTNVSGEVIQLVEHYYRGDYYKYMVKLT